jgi:hypothetical protein
MNPTLWFDQPDTTDPNDPDPKPTDPLQPFHRDTKNSSYDSDMVKDWTKFNYTYDNLGPLLQPGSDNATAQPEMLLAAQSAHAAQPHGVSVSHATSTVHHATLKRTLNSRYGNTRRDILNTRGIHGLQNDYIVNIVYDRYIPFLLPLHLETP